MKFNKWKALPVRLRGGIIIVIPVVCLFTSLTAFAWLKATLEEEERVIQHTKLVKLETKRLLTALVDTETGVRGYGLTHREEFLAPYNHSREVIPVSLKRLKSLMQDYPEQEQKLEEIQTKVNRHLEILQQKLTLQQKLKQTREEERLVNTVLLYDWLEEGKDKMNATRMAINNFTVEQEELLEARQQHQAFYRQITWIVLCSSAIAGTMGAWLAILLFLQLERELRERETRLQNTNRELELAYAQLDRFTANASHELRAPLAAVLSNAQVGLMELEDLTADTTFLDRRLEKIVHLTKGMSTLVGDLLFLARQESLLSLESLESLNVVDLLRVLISQWQSQARSQNLTLTAHLPERPVMVKADTNLLHQAIDNLLSNSCRYTPAPGYIYIRLNSDKDRVSIEVKDTGIGISPQSLPHIFERFYRVNQTRTKAKGSFGLGLNIAQQIIQAHCGQIIVISKVGQGSTFQIVLPLVNEI